MKKRFFCLVLAVLCTVVFAAPFSVAAAEALDLRTSGDASGAGWSWNAARRTLSVSDLELRTEDTSAVFLPRNSTVLYSGACVIESGGANAVESEGMLSIVESSESASISLIGGLYAAAAEEIVLYGNSITLRGESAAVSGFLEAEDGYSFLVLSGDSYVSAPYTGQQIVRTGRVYPVYAQADTGGRTSFSYQSYAPGESVRLRAYAKPGYVFDSWSGNVSFADPKSADTSFVMPARAVRVSASFKRVYSLFIAESEGGYVIQDTPGNAFEPGTTVLVYAVANTGYYFSHWASDYGAFRDPLQAYAAYTMPRIDATLTPVFIAGESYTLTVGHVGEGSTNVSLANLPEGRRITLTATPAENYVFSGWMADGGFFSSSEDATTTFTMPGSNAYVTAVFAATEAAKSTVTVAAKTGGNVNLTGGSFVPGVTLELSAAAKNGYRFVAWETDEESDLAYLEDASSPETTLIVPPADIAVYARFELIDPNAPVFYCAVGSGEGGTVLSEGTGYYIAGYELDLSAIPDEGYYFAGWTSAVGGKFDSAADENTVFRTPANDTKVLARFLPISESGSVPEGGAILTPTDPDDFSPPSGEDALLPVWLAAALTAALIAFAVWILIRSGQLADFKRFLRYGRYRRRRKRLRPKREL